MNDGDRILQCVKLTPDWTKGLTRFFRALEENGDTSLFSPHPATEEAIGMLARRTGRDLYCLLVEGEKVLGYGLLRGWDQGYEIPSLGIAMHASASRRGATRVRLRVRGGNEKAVKLYEDLGYIFEKQEGEEDYLIGLKSL